jgi:ankyrin repeat protein
LLEASRSGNLDQVKQALNAGADINILDKYKRSALHYAVMQNHIEVVKFLLKSGININSQNIFNCTPLHYASNKGFATIVMLLFDSDANRTLTDNTGRTALSSAELCNKQEIVRLYERYFSSLEQEAQNNPTRNTLIKAIKNNYPSIVKLLLKRDIFANKTDLALAKQYGHKETGRMIIKYRSANPGQSLISKNGLGLPADIAQHIMSYTL